MNGVKHQGGFDPIACNLTCSAWEDSVRHGITAGCVAGIAGMTGFEGLGEYSTRVRLRTKNCVRNACRGRLHIVAATASISFHYSIMVYSLFISLHLLYALRSG
jgi:hypothetical protein